MNMLKLTDDEMKTALAEADRMRDKDDDPHHLARAVHYLEHRARYLETVYKAAKNYIHFGQEEEEHSRLLKAIEAARSEELKDREQEDETLGL